MTDPDYTAEEKLAKAKHDAEVAQTVTIRNMSEHPIVITHPSHRNFTPDVVFTRELGEKTEVEYIRMDEHERLIREARERLLEMRLASEVVIEMILAEYGSNLEHLAGPSANAVTGLMKAAQSSRIWEGKA